MMIDVAVLAHLDGAARDGALGGDVDRAADLSNEREPSGACALPGKGALERLDAAVDALGEARVRQAPRVAARGSGGDAGRRHQVGDRQKPARGKQIADDLGALSLAHGPGRFLGYWLLLRSVP